MRIYSSPASLRVVGLIFFLAGLLVLILLTAGLASGKTYSISDICIGFGVGLVFAFVGWAVFADDYVVIDGWSREVVFYQRLLRAKETGRMRLTDTSRLIVEPDPDHPRCYRLMLDDYLLRERMSKPQIERLKDKIKTLLLEPV